MMVLYLPLSLFLSTFVHSGLAAVLNKCDLPVSVFHFNTVLLLYLACTGIENPYYPNHLALPQGSTLSINSTQLDIPQVRISMSSSGDTGAVLASSGFQTIFDYVFILRNIVQPWMTHYLGICHKRKCGVMDRL